MSAIFERGVIINITALVNVMQKFIQIHQVQPEFTFEICNSCKLLVSYINNFIAVLDFQLTILTLQLQENREPQKAGKVCRRPLVLVVQVD